MQLFFADDSRQQRPSRPGMGPLVAIGGISIPDEAVYHLERACDALCEQFGFPLGIAGEFKWSPGNEHWMRNNLIEGKRQDFFSQVLLLATSYGAKALVVLEDTSYATATGTPDAHIDVARLFLERVESQLNILDTRGLVIVDRPSGGRSDEDAFLADCLEVLQSGTDYVKPEHILLNVLSTPSKLVRLLQLADLVTSCTTAFIGGENRYSPPIFDLIRPLFYQSLGRIGGVGLKLHPDYRYMNLYHWLVGDNYFRKGGAGVELPWRKAAYASNASSP
ncbi:MAG TPA: DUF3800 domain-containing protein [Ktedonobacterales bacterium]|nr:DUF3800 domain-containing protein [Ktedonobacterales bacterium]